MLKEGKVIRKIQGFYFVDIYMNFNNIESFENSLMKCKLRGSLKEKNKKDNCIIGDIVTIDTELKTIENIKERKNFITRPLISNVDSIAICFSSKEPNFDIIQFQKILLQIHKNNIEPLLILTKSDLLSDTEKNDIYNTLKKDFPYLKFFFISLKNEKELEIFKEYIKGKDIIISGPSGVGKSSLINYLLNKDILKVGEISKKTKKGKNTTVDTRFFPLNSNFLIDTPGFSSVEFPKIKDYSEIKDYFPEILELSKECKFKNCLHISEPNCNVKEKLNKTRYEFYKLFLNNLKDKGE